MFKHRHRWEVIWPYPDGYGTWCNKCKTLLDSGLSEINAQTICKELGGL